jgi:DNA segregation ATPase FtsK/SpoIIIE and related proteins
VSKGKNSVVGIAVGVLLAKVAGKTVTGIVKLIRRLLFRWRRILAPLWCGFGLWLFAVLYRWLIRDWWPMVLLIGAAGLALAVLGPRLSERVQAVVNRLVPDGLDRGRHGVLDSLRERVYLGALLTYITWYLALRIADGSTDLTKWSWQLGVLIFGGLWWWHRRIRTIGKADKYLRSWPKLAQGKTSALELKPLVGSKPVEARGTGGTVRIRVKLAEGITAAHVAKATSALASFWGLRPGSVFAAEHETNSRWVWLTLLPSDPWKGKITHPMPVPGSTSLAERNLRFDMGLHADGRLSLYKLQHTLLVGASGMGKSAWIEALMIWLLACQDVAIIGIDMASGATLGIWRKVLALPLATDLDSAIETLKRVLALVEDRERQLGVSKEDDESDIDSFQPTPETPWLVLVIDEFPDLVMGEDGKPHRLVIGLLGRIAKRARKAGVKLLFASQNGSKTDMGAKEIQAQFTCVVSLGLDQHASRVLWVNLERLGWNSTHLRVGQYLQRDADHMTPDIAKGYFVPPSERRAAVRQAAGDRPQFEPSAWMALNGAVYDYRDEESDSPRSRPVPREPADAVLAAIIEQPRTASEIAELEGTPSRATVFRRLQAMKESGQAHSINGVWYPGPVLDGETQETKAG